MEDQDNNQTEALTEGPGRPPEMENTATCGGGIEVPGPNAAGVGVNVCQIDEMIRFARNFIKNTDELVTCDENEAALCLTRNHLNFALECLTRCKQNLEERGVEGRNQV